MRISDWSSDVCSSDLPAPYAAAVRNAEGRLGIERARLVNAEQQHSRITSLHRSGFATGRGRDQAEADLMAARSAVASARAELDRARLDLSYTHVRAPISGITGTESRSEGSLIDATSPESSLLTTITQADRSEEHTSELQSLMRISYAVFCLKKKHKPNT